jgi:hypothetical protein
MESPLALQERVENVGQPSIGLTLWAELQDNAIASVTARQKWMVWKQSSLSWCLQAVGGSGGLLNVGHSEIVR